MIDRSVLRLSAGLLLPPLFMLIYPWQMGSVWTLLLIALVAVTAGWLLRSWWATATVPAGMVGAMIAYALATHGRPTIADMPPTAMLISLGIMSCLVGCMALVGVSASRPALPDVG